MKKLISLLLTLACSFSEPVWAQSSFAPNNPQIVGSLSNVNSTSLPYLRKAVANAVAGTAKSNLCFAGDSTTTGLQNATTTLDRPNSYPYQLASLLSGMGLPTSTNSFFSTGGYVSASPPNIYDIRLTYSGFYALADSVGGLMFTVQNTGTLSFQTSNISNADTADIYYITNSGYGGFTVNINGGATLATIAEAGAASLQKTTVSFTSTANPILNMVSQNNGRIFIIGADVYSSTTPSLHIFNLGGATGSTTNLATAVNPWDYLNAMTSSTLNCSVIFLSAGINDWVQALGASTTAANMATIMAAIPSTADVVMISPFPTNNGVIARSLQAPYVAAFIAQAYTSKKPLFDWNGRVTSWEQMNALGMIYDSYHPAKTGYNDLARALVPLFFY